MNTTGIMTSRTTRAARTLRAAMNVRAAATVTAAMTALLLCTSAFTAFPAFAADDPAVDAELLKGRRFEFSWTSRSGGAVNGIALLKENGRIEGIGSPNETSWAIDEAGRLLFRHADGRVSTRYEKVWRDEGLLRFEGPFLFRDGITHHLLEIESARSERMHRITPADAERIVYSTQTFRYLDPGETTTFTLKDGTTRTIGLESVADHCDGVVDLVRRATVRVTIDGEAFTLDCAPYVLPLETQGLRIQADTTNGWLAIPKRVQLSLWDAEDPVVDSSRFGFPLPGYRLFSHGMQAYDEPVHLGHRDGDPAGGRFHHDYGVDFAGYEARQKVVSCIGGEVVLVNRDSGDLAVRDERGFVLHFGHLDSILGAVQVGSTVRKGEWVAMLGRRGSSGNFAHLHVGAYLSTKALESNRNCRVLNLYPWLVAAWLAESDERLLAVARPHKVAFTGEPVHFDGTQSIACRSPIVDYGWEFHDGTTAAGARAQKVYTRPGCYCATLRVENGKGDVDVDFCKVKVYTRSAPEEVVPTLFVTHLPAREVAVGEPVFFRAWPQGGNVGPIRIDFGDGCAIENYRAYSAVCHAFATPGLHVVTVRGDSAAKGMPVMQLQKIIVRE